MPGKAVYAIFASYGNRQSAAEALSDLVHLHRRSSLSGYRPRLHNPCLYVMRDRPTRLAYLSIDEKLGTNNAPRWQRAIFSINPLAEAGAVPVY
ncbi:hypothetical protein EDWATA_02055 [Edwardsiella tarda ATCC 23685]|uniref:Uncharacterized protein n=1 Tax=Edwardsiella tarda ATCC 23685 TaxID=500638 RepID=D4F5M7_EDWTA|nr:hypothetical protein EDWATA_02055 [Edwardsiella tarda ATCC 23685]